MRAPEGQPGRSYLALQLGRIIAPSSPPAVRPVRPVPDC